MCNGDLLARKFRFQFSGPRSFPGRIEYEFLIFDSDVMNLLLKRLNFFLVISIIIIVIIIDCSALIVNGWLVVAWGRRVLYRVS